MTLDELEARGATCTVPEAGEVMGISRGTAYEAARNGELPVVKLGHRLVVPVCRLHALLEGTPTPDTTNGAPHQDAAVNTRRLGIVSSDADCCK